MTCENQIKKEKKKERKKKLKTFSENDAKSINQKIDIPIESIRFIIELFLTLIFTGVDWSSWHVQKENYDNHEDGRFSWRIQRGVR